MKVFDFSDMDPAKISLVISYSPGYSNLLGISITFRRFAARGLNDQRVQVISEFCHSFLSEAAAY